MRDTAGVLMTTTPEIAFYSAKDPSPGAEGSWLWLRKIGLCSSSRAPRESGGRRARPERSEGDAQRLMQPMTINF
jgi:hypothetical protein